MCPFLTYIFFSISYFSWFSRLATSSEIFFFLVFRRSVCFRIRSRYGLCEWVAMMVISDEKGSENWVSSVNRDIEMLQLALGGLLWNEVKDPNKKKVSNCLCAWRKDFYENNEHNCVWTRDKYCEKRDLVLKILSWSSCKFFNYPAKTSSSFFFYVLSPWALDSNVK